MAEERVQRRLAAILAADVVGYSRLMHADESGTLAALRLLRQELIEPKVAEFHGRIFKTMGDGFLIEFSSAVDAVQYAIDVQYAMGARQNDQPADSQVMMRIGITLGDVIVEEDDVFGDGVNVASRLEGIADPGGIAVSLLVRESVRHKLAVDFDDLGEKSLKNIADPVHVFQIGPAVSAGKPGATGNASFRRPAVAVLPFANMSGDPEQEYFADGLSEDIITALTAWRFFPVIARNSSHAYKGKSPDIRKVGEELGARYVIEGSVRKSGNRVRVTAQFVNAETGHHVWAERFDRDLQDIFELQDEITGKIVASISPEFVRAESDRLITRKPENLDAWDCCLRGKFHMNDFSRESLLAARELFEKAVELDANSVDGWWGISHTYFREYHVGHSQDLEHTRLKTLEAARRAVDLDDANAAAHICLSHAYTINKEYAGAELEANRAIALNPTDPVAYAALSLPLILAGRPEEGAASLETTIGLNASHPRVHLHRATLARAHLDAGRYEKAVDQARQAIKQGRFNMDQHLTLVSALGYLGRGEEAISLLRNMEEYRDLRVSEIVLCPSWQLYNDTDPNEHLFQGLRKAGLQE